VRKRLNFLAAAMVFIAAAAHSAELPPPGLILADVERVADWQLAHLAKLDYVDRYREESEIPTGWVQGVLYLGLTRLADRTQDDRYADAVLKHNKATGWSVSGPVAHADFQLIGQSYFWEFGRDKDPDAIAAILQRFDQVIEEHPDMPLDFDGADVPDVGKPCQKRWCWSDALFMAPATWATATQITSDPRYLAYADKEFRSTVQKLYDPKEHLFYRDSTQIKIHTFWSRGNGWVLAGLARFLEALPGDYPDRGRYESLFKEMARRVMELQSPGGTWPPSLLDAKGAPPETSGTALFVFGLAWGVNHGLLDRKSTMPVLIRGWSALQAAIQPDGRLGWVQRIGYAPDTVSAEDTQLYGTGALLLAGVELSQGSVAKPAR
jgi:unsaturated rhamnogalacturonyl hydrolase